jgi:hypothetical protein
MSGGPALGDNYGTQMWAERDSKSRLQVFGSIVQMEQTGYLRSLFAPQPVATTSTNGLGAVQIPIGLVIVIAVAVVAAIFLVLAYMYESKRLESGNKILEARCKYAEDHGDRETMLACIEAAKGLQRSDMFGLSEALKTLAWGAVAIGAAYVGFVYILPSVLKTKASMADMRIGVQEKA